MSSSRPELRLPSPSAIFDEDGGDGLSFAAPRASAIAASHSASSRLSSTIRNHPNVSEIITRSSAASNNRAASAVAGSSTHTITPNNVLGSPSRSIRTERGNAPSYKKKAVNSKRSQCDIAENPTATQDVKMRKSAKKESADLKPFAHVDQMSSSQVVSSSSRKRGRPHGTDNATKVIESGRIKREHGIKALSDGEARFEPSQAQQRQLSDAFLMQQMQMDKKVRPQQLYQKKSRHALSTLDKTTIKPSWSATSVYKRAKKAKIGPMHKRPARVRSHCPQTIMDRCDRAMSQRMFMIERVSYVNVPNQVDYFKVLGSTGNVYTVTIGDFPSCDCPDCIKGNSPCKHIIFVFLKVLKVPEDSSVWYQKGLTPAEVQWVFRHAPPAPTGSIAVPSNVRDAYLRATGNLPEQATSTSGDSERFDGKRIKAIGEDCPVCYEEMTQQDDVNKRLIYDDSASGCGRPLHAECFRMWAATAKKSGKGVTCVWCRNEWPTGITGGKGKGKAKEPSYDSMGYLNMASVAGMRRTRDTSTYHRGWRFGNDDSDGDYF
ncbi:hypothetical protein C356_01179 [Cryptococcus neoformans c45]|nr:hypothetical protein C356_01179 [Cryptococcus neoformans var. grubii c45]